ncbi:MAG: AFG1/ZapE family ATPase, partial [Novosphingobium sp.]
MNALLARYEALVAAGELRPDPEQRAAAARLAQLQQELDAPQGSGLLGTLVGKKAPSPRRLSLWGGVGRGQSMLM